MSWCACFRHLLVFPLSHPALTVKGHHGNSLLIQSVSFLCHCFLNIHVVIMDFFVKDTEKADLTFDCYSTKIKTFLLFIIFKCFSTVLIACLMMCGSFSILECYFIITLTCSFIFTLNTSDISLSIQSFHCFTYVIQTLSLVILDILFFGNSYSFYCRKKRKN